MTRQGHKITGATLVIVLFILLANVALPTSAGNRQISYELLDHPGGSTHYRLNVAITQSLLEYYEQRSHSLNSMNDFGKFVTPYAVEPIATSVRKMCKDDEDFSNAALMIVHQIPYQATIPCKYPVETMMDNAGDCDLLSFVVASILEAGGLQVVLLYYDGGTEAHMNIGISLPQPPQDTRSNVHYVVYEGNRYYVAECTGGDWQAGWRVGEYPEDQGLESAQVISLENIDDPHAGQVSASYENLEASAISLAISPTILMQEGTIALSGDLNPPIENATITIYTRMSGSPWKAFDTTQTTEGGHFSYAFSPENSGICEVRVGWSGTQTFAAADSPIRTITVISAFLLILVSAIIILACLGIAMFIVVRRNSTNVLEPQPPQEPA